MTKKKSSLSPQATREVKNALLRVDGWHSAMTGIGGLMEDKRLWAQFNADPTNVVENAELWRGDDLAARIVETIPNEMLRQGFELSIEGDAGGAKDKIKDITAYWEDLGLVDFLNRALCYERAYGGAAILLGVNDLREMSEPLDDDSVTSFNWLEVFEPLELHAMTWQNDPNKRGFGYPDTYMLHPVSTGGSKVSGVTIHASRLLIFPGIRVSRRLLSAQPGWGDAVLTRCRSTLRDFQTAWDATGILIHDFSQAVLKIKGLAEIISLGKDKELQNRIRAIQLSRSVARAVVIDADAEEFKREQTPLTGLAELLDKFGTRLAASADMPLTLLMGTSPGGLNATGESDIRGFYDRVKSKQVQKLRPVIERVIKLIMRVKGIEEPDSWAVKFHPLWQPTELELAQARFTQSQTDEKNITNSILDPAEVRRSRFGGPEYSYETQIDPTLDLKPPAPLLPEDQGPKGPGGTPVPKTTSTTNNPGVYQPAQTEGTGGVDAIRKDEGDDMKKNWEEHYRGQLPQPTLLTDPPLRLDEAPATNEEIAFLAWSDRCDAEAFEPNRDEKGQFASTGAAGAAARSSAKEAVGHARAARALAADNPGSEPHAAAVAHAERAAKGARSAARKAEGSSSAEEASGHAAKAAGHAASAKAAMEKAGVKTPIPRGGPMPTGGQRAGNTNAKDLYTAAAAKAGAATLAARNSAGSPEAHAAAQVAHKEAAAAAKTAGMKAAGKDHLEQAKNHESLESTYRKPNQVEPGRNPQGKLSAGKTGDEGKQANALSAAANAHSTRVGTVEGNQAAAEAHRAAASAQRARGATGTADDHEAAAARHEQLAKELSNKPKENPDKIYRKSVDDYEHSGDTENEMDHLKEHGARGIHVIHEGPDEDGDEGATVGYKLPHNTTRDQFNRLVNLSGQHTPHSSASGVKEAHAEVLKHYEAAKSAARTGYTKDLESHLQKAESAVAKRETLIHEGPANANSKEAYSQTARANQVMTAEAHQSAANAHLAAGQGHRNAGNKFQSEAHFSTAKDHNSVAGRIRMGSTKESPIIPTHYNEKLGPR